MQILWVRSRGYSLEETGRIVGCTVNTVRATLDRYVAGGLEAIRQYAPHRATNPLLLHAEAITASLTERPVTTAKEARTRIEQVVGWAPREDAVRDVLHTLGFRRRKVGGVPAKANVQEQEGFKKKSSCRVWSKQPVASGRWFSSTRCTSSSERFSDLSGA